MQQRVILRTDDGMILMKPARIGQPLTYSSYGEPFVFPSELSAYRYAMASNTKARPVVQEDVDTCSA